MGNTYRLESYLHRPEGGGLIITPKRDKIPKIHKVELFYVDDTKGSVFSFTEKLRTRAYCSNMFNKELVFTLWEDDAKGSGHNQSNKEIDTKKAKVNENGVAVAEFLLTKALMQKAMQGEIDTKQLEFYVTVEYYQNKKHATENVNINNPFHVEPATAKGTAKKDKEPTTEKSNRKSTQQVNPPADKKQKDDTCVCETSKLYWGKNFTCEERKKIVEISKRLLCKPDYLTSAMALETGGKFDPSIVNSLDYTGLIQIGITAADVINRRKGTKKNNSGK